MAAAVDVSDPAAPPPPISLFVRGKDGGKAVRVTPSPCKDDPAVKGAPVDALAEYWRSQTEKGVWSVIGHDRALAKDTGGRRKNGLGHPPLHARTNTPTRTGVQPVRAIYEPVHTAICEPVHTMCEPVHMLCEPSTHCVNRSHIV